MKLCILRFLSVLNLLLLPGGALFSRGERVISFSGYSWIVRQSRGVEGPGPNRFSSDASSVWVDEEGLHLTLREDRRRWFSSEVIGSEGLGYGRYRFVVEADWAELPLNAVLGLFTYSDNPDYYHREIDIEFSAWGDPYCDLGLFTRQPYNKTGQQQEFSLKDETGQYPSDPLVCEFTWMPGEIHYRAARFPSHGGEGEVLSDWVFRGNVPPPGDETVRMNLWLYRGRPGERPFEVIIKSFTFEAYREQDNETYEKE